MFCEKCGSELSKGARFCPGCGNSITHPEETASPERKSEPIDGSMDDVLYLNSDGKPVYKDPPEKKEKEAKEKKEEKQIKPIKPITGFDVEKASLICVTLGALLTILYGIAIYRTTSIENDIAKAMIIPVMGKANTTAAAISIICHLAGTFSVVLAAVATVMCLLYIIADLRSITDKAGKTTIINMATKSLILSAVVLIITEFLYLLFFSSNEITSHMGSWLLQFAGSVITLVIGLFFIHRVPGNPIPGMTIEEKEILLMEAIEKTLGIKQKGGSK